jgi:type II secretory pathway pseudopilin PulG
LNNMRIQVLQKQHGQTLVETVVGIFVLTIGISTALGLAVAMFNATTSAVKQVVAAGLAREGVEAVFNMRGTNWLKDQNLETNCWDYVTSTATAYCHSDWLKLTPTVSGSYDLEPAGGSRSYTLDFTPSATDGQTYWNLVSQPPGNPQFRLYYDAAASSGAFYKTSSSGAVASDYYREIILTTETTPSYYQASIGPRLKVTSRVWWEDRNCPSSPTWSSSGKCHIELVTYLTNWRNY